jgi:predicted dehydrogenase
MTDSCISWGIIGCGDVTEVKSGPGFQKADGSALVAVMRRNGDLAQDYARRHGVRRWYDDAQALINDPGVDAIYVATPPSTHKQYALAAANAGKPVLVEKPMARNYAECEEMVRVCRDANVKLFAAYYRRALPRFLKVKSLLDEGAIGRIRSVDVRYSQGPTDADRSGQKPWRVIPEIAGAGYFLDLASHTVDLLRFLLGEIVEVEGKSSNLGGLYPAEDLVTSRYVFESGAMGVGSWDFGAEENADRVEIVGSEGTITFATFANVPIALKRTHNSQEFVVPHPPHVHQPLIQTIVDDLRGRGVCPSPGTSGARTSWVLDKMLGRE